MDVECSDDGDRGQGRQLRDMGGTTVPDSDPVLKGFFGLIDLISVFPADDPALVGPSMAEI